MRTFSEEEARAVFAEAARTAPVADDLGGERLTLAELVEIGRASGLDPERVALAAQGLGAAGASRAAPARTLLGVPMDIYRTRTVPGLLVDETWEEAVDAARTLFGGPGTAELIGRVRQWTSPASSGSIGGLQTRVTARPGAGTTTVRIEREGQQANVWGVLGTAALLVLLSLVPLVMMAAGAEGSGGSPLPFSLTVAAFGLLFGAGGIVGLRRGARVHAERMDAALDRIELAARFHAETPDAAPGQAEAPAGARLDLATLDDPAAADASPAPRTRTR